MSDYSEHLISMAGGDGDPLEAADAAYTRAVQAAVAGHGDWASVQVAGNVVRQARSAAMAS